MISILPDKIPSSCGRTRNAASMDDHATGGHKLARFIDRGHFITRLQLSTNIQPGPLNAGRSLIRSPHRPGRAAFPYTLRRRLASLRIGLMSSHQHRNLSMAKGTVKWFNPTKGYGFIQPASGGGKDVFVHISAVAKAGLSTLNEGQVVEYEEVPNKGKTSAENLKVQRCRPAELIGRFPPDEPAGFACLRGSADLSQ